MGKWYTDIWNRKINYDGVIWHEIGQNKKISKYIAYLWIIQRIYGFENFFVDALTKLNIYYM